MKSFRWMYSLIKEQTLDTLDGPLMTSRFLAPKEMPTKIAQWLGKRKLDKAIMDVWKSLAKGTV